MERNERSLLAACLLMMSASPAHPAVAEGPAPRSDQPLETIVVVGRNIYRDRTEDLNPTLSYDLSFFQPFEPLTVGEMLKRVPGASFSSDVLEFDGVQMRGLAAQYTTILINGREIPGQGADGSFFVDRIPAELVDDIEIIRSPSANMTSEGIGGALNVILKDGVALEGVLAKVGGTYYGNGDGKVRGTAAVAVAGSGNGYDYWTGFNVQERRNPKRKIEQFYDADSGMLEGYALENDVRDGDDWSFNGALRKDVGNAELRVEGFYVFTDREETELNRAFEGDSVGAGELDEIEDQVEQIDQSSYGLDVAYTRPVGRGILELTAGVRGYDEDTDELERELALDGSVVEAEASTIEVQDVGYRLGAAYELAAGANGRLTIGGDGRLNRRDGTQLGTLFDVDAEIDETRLAPYVVYSHDLSETLSLELGTRLDHHRREVDSAAGSGSHRSTDVLPSAHLRYDVSNQDRLRLSVARALRRPDFDLTAPFQQDETPGDDDAVLGNPDLDSESSWGVDAGYERRLGRQGVFGINLFYRDVDDLIELSDTGQPFAPGGRIFTPRNVGDGWTRGVELDLSTPLDLLGLPETGLYANYTYMDSEVTDAFTGDKRRFRNQPDYVYNVSLLQNLPRLDATVGVSLQGRGDSLATEFDEYVTLAYDENLEVFYEQRIGQGTVVRVTGTNLLDQEKTETFRSFGAGISEIELEDSSPTVTLTVRTVL